MLFVDALLRQLPTFSECKAVIAWRSGESFTGSVYCSLRTSEISARPPVLSVPHSRPWCLPVASVAGRRRALRRQSCFSSVQDEFRPLPVGSGSATADISELCRSAGCLLSLADHPGQCIFIWERARPGH